MFRTELAYSAVEVVLLQPSPANYGERIATLETKFNWILGSIGAIVLDVSSLLRAHWETICKILDGLKSLSSMTPPST